MLYVSSGLDPRTGGTATAAISVCLAASRAGIEATLVYPVEPDAEASLAVPLQALRDAGVVLHAFPFWAPGGRRAVRWGISPALDRWVRAHAGEFDIIHAHSVWVATSLRAMAAARRAGKPFVLMPHEGLTRFDMARASSSLLVRLKNLLRRRYLAGSSLIILSSELEKLDSRLDGHPAAAVVAHPVFDEQRAFQPLPPRSGPITVGFLGRFHKKKNLHLLIDSLDRAPGVRLKIGGDGDEDFKSALLSRAERHHVTDRIDWAGFIGAAAKDDFFASLDLVAMPSAFECFGLVGAEAMALSIPVLVSPTVGIAEEVQAEGGGLVVPPRPDALGVALSRLDRDVLAEWGAKARQTALNHYSFAAHGARLKALYAALIA